MLFNTSDNEVRVEVKDTNVRFMLLSSSSGVCSTRFSSLIPREDLTGDTCMRGVLSPAGSFNGSSAVALSFFSFPSSSCRTGLTLLVDRSSVFAASFTSSSVLSVCPV